MLDTLGEWICRLDAAGRIVYANAAMVRGLRCAPGELDGRRFLDLVDSSARDAARQVLSQAGVAVEPQVWQQESANGEAEIWREWTFQRLEGPKAGLLATGRDITEQKRLEHQFLHAQRVGSIGMLASGIAHDLNNVLAPIVMSVDLLKLRAGSEENRALLDVVSTSAGRGASLVSQMLTFSRGLDGRREHVDVAGLIKELARFIGRTFAKNIRIRTEVAADLRPLHANPTQIYQVLLNLCVNARDAMPAGGDLTITAGNVTLDQTAAASLPGAVPGEFVMLGVSDTGTGIAPEIVAHIYEPFFTTKPVGEGTGLGLSTVRSVLKASGGFSSLATQPGQGTTFHLYFPVKHVHEEKVEATEAGENARGAGEHVLIVDDEEFFREVSRRLLRDFGYVVHVAAEGEEAVRIFSAHREEIAVALVDLNMPVMDGRTTIRELRAIDPHLRVVTVSGSEEMARPGDDATDMQLTKPYSMTTLLGCLREVLSRDKAART